MKKIKLSVTDRMALPLLLPKKYGLVDGEIIQDVKERIKITSKEMQDMEMRDLPNGSLQWNAQKEKAFDLELSDRELEILKKGVEEADKANSLDDHTINVALKINKLWQTN